MKFNVAEIESFAQNLTTDEIRCSPGGIASNFVSIDDNLGIKIFRDSFSRDFARDNQYEASICGFAPQVYDSINLKKVFRYGYITEKVDVMSRVIQREYNGETIEIHDCDSAMGYEHSDAMKKLIHGLAELEIFFLDNHSDNIGLKNGNLVCIDFGEEGMARDIDEFYEIIESDKDYLLSCIEDLL